MNIFYGKGESENVKAWNGYESENEFVSWEGERARWHYSGMTHLGSVMTYSVITSACI